ncbi:MAG: hypothetical protein FGM54_08605 [Chitinophagaceae bacterium]|nr:hypothetical protein [Chitinophagaceae bacterium]
MTFFLDIDGVMVPIKSWKSPVLLNDGFPAFSPTATEVLKNVLKNKDRIIITSSHKDRFNELEWKQLFAHRGIILNELSRLPSTPVPHSRYDELMQWFSYNTIDDAWAILDDDSSLNNLPKALKEHLILTKPMLGLCPEHKDMIEALRCKETV